METRYQEYLDSIQRRVCSVCIDAVESESGEFVRCGLSDEKPCAIRQHLPELVEAIRSVDSDWMDDYVKAVRDRVCGSCENSDGENCDRRQLLECALDRYAMLVIRAIEEADASFS